MTKSNILQAVEIMCEVIGEDQVVANIATRIDENSFNEKEVTLGDIKREIERLYIIEQETIHNQMIDVIVEQS